MGVFGYYDGPQFNEALENEEHPAPQWTRGVLHWAEVSDLGFASRRRLGFQVVGHRTARPSPAAQPLVRGGVDQLAELVEAVGLEGPLFDRLLVAEDLAALNLLHLRASLDDDGIADGPGLGHGASFSRVNDILA